MFRAYCETSVKRLRKNVPARPPTMVSTPTPSGSPAATTEAKMTTSKMSVTGSVTVSARCRSLSNVLLKASLTGTKPVPVTVSELELTWPRSAL